MASGTEETNPFSFDDEDDEEPGQKSKPFTDLRKHARGLERQLKEVTPELEELRQFRMSVMEERKEQAISKAFEEVNLNPAHAKLFKALNPEVEVESITPEAVASFASEYALIAVSGEEVEAPEEKPAGFKPVVTGSGAPLKEYTSEDVMTLLRQGKVEEANAAVSSGRVAKESVPWRQQ